MIIVLWLLARSTHRGYEDAIVYSEFTANNFEIKHGLLNHVKTKQFFGNDKEDPHAHIRYFNKITSTMKIPNGGLRSDENFNAREYWERISIDRDLHLSRSSITSIARKSKVLTEEIVRTLSTLVYCIDLDRTTLRELIDSEDKLIPDIADDDVQRVATQRAPRVQRASMQDLYERMGSLEIRVLTTHLVMFSPVQIVLPAVLSAAATTAAA
ncbi:hypothetical protein Tco_1504381 [Tanacetum coccineum]